MAQNVYDDPDFFAAYAGLLRQQDGLDGAPEWPAMRAMLPDDMTGLRVVDLGCGYGWIARWAESAGAAGVVAVDVSARMLERARSFGDGGRIDYVRADLDEYSPDGPCEVVVSSLTLRYVRDLRRLVRACGDALVPGGRFVVSCEHPIYLAPYEPRFVARPGGHEWPVSGYHREGRREVGWLGHDGVVKYHRRIDSYVAALRGAGLELTDLVEWGPSDEHLAEHPEWAPELERPMILLLGATRSHI